MNSLFRVSERNHAGLIFMTELAVRESGRKFVRLNQVAKEMKLSSAYLEEIVRLLKQAGLIEGRTGRQGGYRLARPAKDVTVEQVLMALEGPLALVECQSFRHAACPVAAKCHSQSIWNLLQRSIVKTLRSTTLRQLVQVPSSAA